MTLNSLGQGALLYVLILLGCVGPSFAKVLHLTQTQAAITVDGVTRSKHLQLPYHWDQANPGQRGGAVFDFRFELAEAPDDVWAIYAPRLGNAYEVWLNGSMLQRQGDLQVSNGADYARVPRYISVDSGHLQLSNHLRVRIRADVGRRGGLAPIAIGPQDEVYPLYLDKYRWRVTGSVAVAAFCFVIGLTALSLWSIPARLARTDRMGRDPLYFFSALAQLCWAIYVLDVMVEDPPLPWPWWGIVQVMALSLWGSSMALACAEIAQWRGQPMAQPFLRSLSALVALCPVLALWALGFGQPTVLTLWYGAFALTLLVFVLVFLWSSVRQSGVEQRIVALAAVVNVVVALRDIYVFRIDQVLGANTWLRYSSLLFGLALGYVVLVRFRGTSIQLHELLGTLTSRVSQREEALRDTYAKLEVLARGQERLAERGRILRNMHDGVGAHISSAMRQLEANREGDPAREAVLLTLRDALDQLKLSIDSIHLVPGDITALLANLRYRLGPRFVAMGIDLQWDVDLLPICPEMDASTMGELQFMLFEALSNVLQHANAKVLRIEGHAEGDSQGENWIFVRVIDDGRGFDVRAVQSRGLATLRDRAVSIGAHFQVTSQPGRTMVELRLGA